MEFTKYLRNFQRARFRADLAQAWSHLTGRSIDLLDFDEVRRRLHAELTGRRNLREIPIAAIVGSVGRPGDFTRDFLPLNDRDAYRWAEVKQHFDEPRGVPPIEVYQVGEVYFVLDGNHRVSVARDLGATHIEAYVTEVRTRVSLTPDTDPRELILKSRYVEFLERTRLDQLRPGADLQVTRLGHYAELERHIHLHRYVMGIEQRREVPEAEAVADWYDNVYLPVVRAIREHSALERFPGRTETDLYLAVSGYRLLVDEYLDWEFENGALGDDDPARSQPGSPGFLGRVVARLVKGDPEAVGRVLPGRWRHKQAEEGLPPNFRLFTNLLVPVPGSSSGWAALDLAFDVARNEHGRVLGLHVVPEAELRTDPRTLAVKAEFERRCQEAGLMGRLAIDVGDVAARICERSAWVDMTVVRLTHPPRPEPWVRLGSGFRSLIRSCASPLLVTPVSNTASLKRALVAYNGSPKAEGALQVAAYLAQRWGVALAVVSVSSGGFDAETALARARHHLAGWNVTAAYLGEAGPVAEVVLQQADAQASDLIILGGYGHGPLLEIALGSTVDHVLRRSLRPTLICP